MRILYVTPLVAGFRDILEGGKESKGLPSFILPLRKLLEDDNQVDIVLVSNYSQQINIQVDWIHNKNILANVNNDFASTKGVMRFALKIKSLLELSIVLNRALKTEKYDFVYCHGTAAYLGNVLANKYNTRCGYRIYGVVNIAHDIRNMGLRKAKRKYPIYYKIFTKKKDFILITDDGTNGDYVFRRFNPKRTFPMYFLVNGVDKNVKYIKQSDILTKYNCKGKDYIFHAGRISRLKRQDKVVNVLHELHLLGYRLHLFLAGHISDEQYYVELNEQIAQYDLDTYVHFVGAVERSNMQSFSHDAIATVLLGDSSNQGNVFFECAMAGSIIISYPEESIKKYIDDKSSGFFVKDEKEASGIIRDILSDKYNTDQIREMLKNTIDRELLSWDERVKLEIDLIYGNKMLL